jgi:hypothetical protein
MPSCFNVVDDIIHKVSRVRVRTFDALNRLDENRLVTPSPKRSSNPSLNSK